MNRSPYNPLNWKYLIPDIGRVLEEMDRTPILSVGITPYTRIVPAFFLKNYSIYTINRSSDVDIMESSITMHVLEDHHPKIAPKVHGTGYLLGNFAFQNFLKSRRVQPLLIFNTISATTTENMKNVGIKWIGNDPKSSNEVMYKGSFRALVKKLGLSSLPVKNYPRDEFLKTSFETLWQENQGSYVVQRGDKEVGGNEATFFIHNQQDFERCQASLKRDTTGFNSVIISPFIEGYSTSMLGCVMPQGTLSGPLQLQLIDVPESLHGETPSGCFFGNDLGFQPWDNTIETQAQKVIEGIGEHLRKSGYLGIFGIDFLYDIKRNQIYPNECNPRGPGSLLLYSLMLFESKVPPLEFFHLMAHLGIKSNFDFDQVNQALKVHLPYSHISFSPKGISKMGLPLLAGVYQYNQINNSLAYKGPGISLADLKNPDEFLIIDTVPKLNDPVQQTVPRLFKFIFPRSIAKSSYEIDKEAGLLLEQFAKSLIKASV